MAAFTSQLQEIFRELDQRIERMAEDRAENGGLKIPRAEVKILGQMSLLSNDAVSSQIALAETGEIWIPPGARFEPLFDFPNVVVTRLDAESAPVSKAIKAKEKNKLLIRKALASDLFPNLSERIEEAGGDLAYFVDLGGTPK